MTDLDKMARELLAAECTDRAASLEKSAASDRETGDSIQEAIDSGAGITPDDPQDVAAWLLNDAERAEATAGLLRRAAAALLTAPPGWKLVPVDERQWTDEMRDAGRAAVMAAQCATETWTPRRHFEAAGRNTNGIPEDVLDERGPLTKESIAVMVMGAMLAAAPEPGI